MQSSPLADRVAETDLGRRVKAGRHPSSRVKHWTRQRTSIKAAFRAAGGPLSAREVLEGAAIFAPGLGIATVYRAINLLLADGWLETVNLPGEPPRYEPAGMRRHYHFHCRICGRVFDVEDCPMFEARVPTGFVLEGHSTMLSGVCAACSSAVRSVARSGSARGVSAPRRVPDARRPARAHGR